MNFCNDCGSYGQPLFNCERPQCGFYATQRDCLQTPSASSCLISKVPLVSIAGVDEGVNPLELKNLCEQYPNLELSVLYKTDTQSKPRYPGTSWRKEFLNLIPKNRCAIHLCGEGVFREILSPVFVYTDSWKEISQYGRVQLNINAFKKVFRQEEVFDIYSKLLSLGCSIILQYNSNTKEDILKYVEYCPQRAKRYVDILIDGSKGQGIELNIADVLIVNNLFKGHFVSFAGGIKDSNVTQIVNNIENIRKSYDFGIDLESGVRTDFDKFSLARVRDLMKK